MVRLEQARINRLGRRFAHLNRHADIYVYLASENMAEEFQSVGLDAAAEDGDAVLPPIVGSISFFNAEGSWIVHADQPKESRVVGQRIWRWREFRGRYDSVERERTIDIERDCYPRTFVEPPAVEMVAATVEGRRRLVSAVPADSDDTLLIHTINLYLESFGVCEVSNDPQERPAPELRRVNWRILPEGDDPWDRARSAVRNRNLDSADSETIILDRQDHICSFGPNEIFVGRGGFDDYLAYIFEERGVVVLESVTRGNAIYVFERNWENFSQLTKREIIQNDLHLQRIVHATGWKQRFAQLMRQ